MMNDSLGGGNMMNALRLDSAYIQFVSEIKQKYQLAQLKVARRVNLDLIEFYWHLGNAIIQKQTQAVWGDKFLEQLSVDLQREFI